METFREIELCQPSPFVFGDNGHLGVTDGTSVSVFGDNGHLGVTDGTSVWIVVVTCEAMHATATPPEASLERLVRYAGLYRDMAEAMINRHEDQNGKVWIFEKDILARRVMAAHDGASRARAAT